MALILSIETATKNCSVALSNGGDVLALKELSEEKFSHAEKLHSFILDVVKHANFELSDLDAIAVSKGPGSYTGLRIGVSTAKGLCYALDIPLIAIPTLESLARQVRSEAESIIIPLLDARRMEVYSAVYSSTYVQIRETQAQVIEAMSFSDYLNSSKVIFLGDGSTKTKEAISHKNAIFMDGRLPSAKEMAPLAHDKFDRHDFEDLAYFEPFYLKDFVAGKPKKYF